MDDLIVQGDRFALRYHWTAPHGDGEIGSEALEINRVEHGQVVETWNYQDMLSLMVQLGVIEDPSRRPADDGRHNGTREPGRDRGWQHRGLRCGDRAPPPRL